MTGSCVPSLWWEGCLGDETLGSPGHFDSKKVVSQRFEFENVIVTSVFHHIGAQQLQFALAKLFQKSNWR